jgi:hypothetical protein
LNQSEAFLLDQVPITLRSMIPTTLKTAYEAAAVLIKSEAILNVASAQDNRGRIIQWAVDLGFEKLVESGQWPFECRWRPFVKPTGHYLEIAPSHSVITISQVVDPKIQPRDVLFRQNKRLNNQGWLTGLPNPRDEGDTSGIPHILLVHGHQDLSFAQLGIPNERHHQGYIYRTPNLMKMPHEVSGGLAEVPVEQTDIDAVMTLKDEIDKWRRDNGQ